MTIYVSDQLQATAAAVSGVPTPDTSWQWLRNGAPISGATSSVYYATADDLGTSISVVQSAINMLGTATATSAADGPVLPFLPSLLFRNAATKGVWYDPSDFTTLFQDAAGTQPVTAVEQPVGLMKDKSGRNNHAFNSSGNSANFPVLSARYNLLTKTEDFSDAVWTKLRSNIIQNASVAPNGTSTADKLIDDTTAAISHLIYGTSAAFTTGVSYTMSLYAKAAERSFIQLTTGIATGGGSRWANFDLSNGTIGSFGADVTPSITAVGNGWFRCQIVFKSTATTTENLTGALITSATAVRLEAYTGDGTSGIYIWGADLRVSNDALNQPAYQRVNTSTDYDTVGFKPYLRFNGTNQWLQTNSIDFTYGDKMFVSAGVRKLSDAASGALLELSSNANTNGGAFWMFYPGDRSGIVSYDWTSKGSLRSDVFGSSSAYVAPVTGVLSGVGDISGDKSIFRINSTQVGSNTTDQGTGNYGNYPLFVGARAGTSLWFNGRLYGLIVAGKLANAVEITETEKYVNGKTAAY